MAALRDRHGGNNTLEEEGSIPGAYVRVSIDTFEGSDQKGTHYYLRIYEAYKEKSRTMRH